MPFERTRDGRLLSECCKQSALQHGDFASSLFEQRLQLEEISLPLLLHFTDRVLERATNTEKARETTAEQKSTAKKVSQQTTTLAPPARPLLIASALRLLTAASRAPCRGST